MTTRAVTVTTPPRLTSSLEDPVALLVDDLLALGDRELHRVVDARMGLGAHEAVLLGTVGEILLDHAAGLVLAVGRIGRRCDPKAVVFDRRLGGHGRSATAPAA